MGDDLIPFFSHPYIVLLLEQIKKRPISMIEIGRYFMVKNQLISIFFAFLFAFQCT